MNSRWSPALILALGSTFLPATEAAAGGARRPSEVNYSKTPVIESHAHALQDSWREVDKSVDRSAKDLSRAIGKYSSQLDKAEAYRAESARKLQEKQAEISGYRSEMTSLGQEINELSGAEPSPQVSKRLEEASRSLSAKTSRISALESEAASLHADYEKANSKAEELKGNVSDTLRRDFHVAIDPDADLRSELARLGDEHIKYAKLTNSARVTDQFLDDIRSDYLKSGMLISDIDALKQQRNFSNAQIQLLQQKMGARLDQTILGKYVHEQIGKAMIAYCQKPEVAAACAKGQVDQLQELLQGALGANRAENSSSRLKAAERRASPGSTARQRNRTALSAE